MPLDFQPFLNRRPLFPRSCHQVSVTRRSMASTEGNGMKMLETRTKNYERDMQQDNGDALKESTGNSNRGVSQEGREDSDKEPFAKTLRSEMALDENNSDVPDNVGSSEFSPSLNNSDDRSRAHSKQSEKEPSNITDSFDHSRIEIRVPPVSDRWKYKTDDCDPRVSRVIRESSRLGDLSYKVLSRDGNKSIVSRP